MKKNGFTLVELLAVIVLLAIIMTIAVPNAFKLNSKVKKKAYLTKIGLIEQAANNYGQSNLNMIRRGTSLDNPTQNYICTFEFDGNKDITSVVYENRPFSETTPLDNTATKKQYWCTKITVEKLVETNNLDWDETDACKDRCTEENKQYYNNIVVDPTNNYIINKCEIYIYYRNHRVYSYFDKNSCDNKQDAVTPGNEYRQVR